MTFESKTILKAGQGSEQRLSLFGAYLLDLSMPIYLALFGKMRK